MKEKALLASTDFVEYQAAYNLQMQLVGARRVGRIKDTILLLQHYPVITVGREGGWQNILTTRESLADQGVNVVESNRGGNITYHGPGQIVGYLIMDLRNHGRDLHVYVRNLEEVIIRVLSFYGIEAHRIPGMTGVWVGEEKIAAIGIRVDNWVTSHGFALNVNTDLSRFSLINPCGITDKGVTSLERLLGDSISVGVVKTLIRNELAKVFGIKLEAVDFDQVRGNGVYEGTARVAQG